MQHRRHKTKLITPAGAGTSHPAEVGDQPGRLGEGRNRIPRAAITCHSIENIRLGTKKTTHALHRRFALTSGLSTADVIRLPNWAGFRIRGGSKMRSQNNKSSPAPIQNSQLTRLIAFNHGRITPGGVSYLSHIQSQSVNAGGHGGPPQRRGLVVVPQL